MIPVEKLYEGDFDGYTKLFIEIPFPIKKPDCIRSPADAVCGPFTRARGMRCPGSTGRFWTSRQGAA